MTPLVSIVIPVFNRCDELETCLRSIEALNYKNYEVIVIDDCSDEDIQSVCSRHNVRIYHKNEKNLGPTSSKNIGLAKAAGEYIWFMDSDAEILSSEVLSSMVSIMTENPDIGSIGGEYFYQDLGKQSLKIKVHRTFINGDGFPSLLSPEDCVMEDCWFVASANCFTRTSLCRQTRGFEEYYYYLYEDIDFCYKLKKLGYRTISDHRCSILHQPSSSSRLSNMYKLQRNRIIFVLLNLSISTILLLPFLDIYYNLKFFKEKRESLQENNTLIRQVQSPILNLLRNVSNFGFSLVLAYLFNLVVLPKTLSIRLSRGNFQV